jgi:Trk K+ transport system NAD-binding subunit
MRRNRLAALVLAIVAFYLGAALLYQAGMTILEGKPRSFLDSLTWAAETISTTGYGADSRWHDPLMVVFIAVVQFVGMFLGPLILATVLLPFFAERFERRVPREADPRLAKHVVIFGYSPAVESLVQRLNANDVRTLVVETDETAARTLMEDGQRVVLARAEEDVIDAARLPAARALVANGTDQENAALVLRARQMGFAGEICAFVEDPAHRKPMELAGASSVYTPRHIVAAALAAHASDTLSPRLQGLARIGGLERRELRIPAGSAAAGRTLQELHLPAAVVGIWSRSALVTRCSPELRVEAGNVIEIVGTRDALDESAALLGVHLLRNDRAYLIAGFGEVGRKVHELLTDVGERVCVIERTAAADVDVAGDVLDSSVLQRAGLAEARALILALDSDDSTLFATVIARDLAPDIPIFARVNHSRNLENIHRAGADYALSIADVTGQMVSARLLGRQTRMREEHRRIDRVEGWKLSGRTPEEIARTQGKTVIAVERGGTVIRRIDASFPIENDDAVWLCFV